MTIAQTLDAPQLENPTEAILLDSEPDTVAVLHHNTPDDMDKQISHRKAIEHHNKEMLEHDRKNKVQVLDEYAG